MIAISKPTQRPSEGTQRVSFDVTRGSRRTRCSLTTKFATKEQATRYFHTNRPLIEKLAREQMERTGIEDGEIKLVMV
jgi:hypothetical protein